MSSKASTTIGFERRYNHALIDTHEEFMAKAEGPLPPRPPNMETIVELNSGPLLGAQPPLHSSTPHPTAPSSSTCASTRVRRGSPGRRVNVPVSGSTFATKAAFVLPERPIVIEARRRGRGEARRRASGRGIFELAGWRLGGGGERLVPVTVDELERRLAAGRSSCSTSGRRRSATPASSPAARICRTARRASPPRTGSAASARSSRSARAARVPRRGQRAAGGRARRAPRARRRHRRMAGAWRRDDELPPLRGLRARRR